MLTNKYVMGQNLGVTRFILTLKELIMETLT